MHEVTINHMPLSVKEYEGKRVVTFKDIDTVHNRSDGTARKRFNDNKAHFIEGEDFYRVTCEEVRPFFGQTLPNGFNPKADIVLITESGYLMLVKSFTDDLAWKVQRELVNSYFRVEQMRTAFSDLSPQLQLLINIETRQREQEKALAAMNNRMQAAANRRLIDMEEAHRRAVTDAANRAQKLCAENAKLETRIEELEHKCQDFTTLETAQLTDLTDLEATMLQALRDMAYDEFQRDEIGTALIGYDYLLKRLEVATI